MTGSAGAALPESRLPWPAVDAADGRVPLAAGAAGATGATGAGLVVVVVVVMVEVAGGPGWAAPAVAVPLFCFVGGSTVGGGAGGVVPGLRAGSEPAAPGAGFAVPAAPVPAPSGFGVAGSGVAGGLLPSTGLSFVAVLGSLVVGGVDGAVPAAGGVVGVVSLPSADGLAPPLEVPHVPNFGLQPVPQCASELPQKPN